MAPFYRPCHWFSLHCVYTYSNANTSLGSLDIAHFLNLLLSRLKVILDSTLMKGFDINCFPLRDDSQWIWGMSPDSTVSVKPEIDSWQLSLREKLIYFSDWFINFVFLQELHLLHEGVHVPHRGREWHRPLLQLQNEVLWEGRAEQKQRHQLPRHRRLSTAGDRTADCVVQGVMIFLYDVFIILNNRASFSSFLKE